MAVRSQPRAGEPAAAQAGPGPARRAAGVTVFAPDDLELVKGGPAERRRYLDDALVAVPPAVRRPALRGRQGPQAAQRPAQGGRRSPRRERRLHPRRVGRQARRGRRRAWPRPARPCSPASPPCCPRPTTPWPTARRRSPPPTSPSGRAAGLADGAGGGPRRDDLRRGVSTVGPHRDDVDLRLAGLPARTHASQGEQRSLALALRLAAHHVITDVTGIGAGPAARRRVLRARPRPQRRPAREPPGGPDAAHERERPAAEGRPATDPAGRGGPHLGGALTAWSISRTVSLTRPPWCRGASPARSARRARGSAGRSRSAGSARRSVSLPGRAPRRTCRCQGCRP